MALPTVEATLQVRAPVFIRKLRRRSDWGQATDELAQRVRDAVEKLFRKEPEPGISVYLVSTDEDLRRVVLGLNAGRDSLKEAVPLVAFLPNELSDLGITPEQTPGNLPCAHANRLHYDITADDEQLSKLCESAINNGRLAGNCSRGAMGEVIEAATKEGCRTVVPQGACQVASC